MQLNEKRIEYLTFDCEKLFNWLDQSSIYIILVNNER